MDREIVQLLLILGFPIYAMLLYWLIRALLVRLRFQQLGSWKEAQPPRPAAADPAARLAEVRGQLAAASGLEGRLNAIDQLADLYQQGNDGLRRQILATTDPDRAVLLEYADYSSSKVRHQALPADAELAFRRGVLAVILENVASDFRDTLTHLFSLYKAGKAKGLDLAALTAELAAATVDSAKPGTAPLLMGSMQGHLEAALEHTFPGQRRAPPVIP